MKRGNYYNNKGGYYKNKYNNRPNQPHKDYTYRYPNDIDTVTKATENGFTGPTSSWFSDEEFFKNLSSHCDFEGKKDYYFNSYSSFNIHEEMLKDRIRTNTYKDAILKNAESFKDKIVLDIGCGTGILSIFAAKAGAKHVYGIEFADVADYAQTIINKNGLGDKITIIKSKVEEAQLPVDKVDIIISEWMGYFLLYESMLDSVLFARDKWLVKDGLMLPDKASIMLTALEDASYKSSKLNFWNNVYGINMKCIQPSTMAEPLIDECPEEAINASSCKIFDIDLYTVKKEDLDFTSKYELTFVRDDLFSGIVAWFDTGFTKLPNKVTLSTSPFLKRTHWKQTIFYTDKDVEVKKGDVVTGSIAVRKAVVNFRQIDVKISYHINNKNGKEDWYQLYKIQ